MDKSKVKRRHQICLNIMWAITVFITACVIWGSSVVISYIDYKRNKIDIEYSERAKEALKRQIEGKQ